MLSRRQNYSLSRRYAQAAAAGRLIKAGYKVAKYVIKNRRSSKKKPAAKSTDVPKFKNVIVHGAGGQITKFIAREKSTNRAASLFKLNPSNVLYWNDAQRLNVNPGSMAFASYGLFTGGALSATESTNNDLASMQYKIEAATTGPQKTSRYFIKSGYASLRMTNQDMGNVEIMIYDVVCRRDNDSNPGEDMVAGLNDQCNGSYTAYNMPPGVTPGSVQLFNTYYKIKQKTRIVLGSGQSHCHQVSLTPNKVFDATMLNDGSRCIKGFTYWILVLVNGMPYNDSTTTTQVSLGQCHLDIVWTKQMKYKWNSDSTNTTNITQNLPTAFTNNEHIMQTDGDIVNDTAA